MKKIIAFVLVLLLILSVAAVAEGTLPDGALYKNGQSETEMNAEAEGKESHEMPSLLYFDNLSSMLLALKSERIGRMFVLQPTAEYIQARNSDVQTSYATPFHVLLSMGVSASNPELFETLNAAIASLSVKGEISLLYEKCLNDIARDPEPADIQTIEGAQTVRVAVTGDLPPLDYVSTDGKAAGFNIELLSAIGKLANINFELVMTDTGSRAAMLASGRADVIFWMETAIQPGENGNDVFYAESAEGLVLTDPYTQVVGVSMTRK